MQGPGNAAEQWSQGPKAATLRFATANFFLFWIEIRNIGPEMMWGWGFGLCRADETFLVATSVIVFHIRRGYVTAEVGRVSGQGNNVGIRFTKLGRQ